jgi:hypothetical protein
MKFEVELIEGGRCIIPMEGQTGLIVSDADLGASLRSIVKPVKPTAKVTRKPRGPNKKKPAVNSDALAGLNT